MTIFPKERLPKDQEETAQKPIIMIVDDEKSQINALKSMLSEDYHIIMAWDCREQGGLINRGIDIPRTVLNRKSEEG